LAQALLYGRVTLDTPVAHILPDIKIPARGGKQITLGELPTQHSALPGMPSNFLPKDQANPYADDDAAKLKAFLARYELRRDPGAAHECSKLGFGLLGYALTQLSHTTYRATTDEELLKPLGMTMTGTAFTDASASNSLPVTFTEARRRRTGTWTRWRAAVRFRSTRDDMRRYLKANMASNSRC
jgi:serine-type D-Ala-D-Ala carboxypeptidase/endopeptidase